jgi:uncharacterized protein YndB with AHSA1/START domain
MSENGYSYEITRTIDAPVAKVWQAWTTPSQYEVWAYSKPGSVEMDVRPGGAWKGTVVTPDGGEFPITGSFLEVVENKRIVAGMDIPGLDEQEAMAVDLVEKGDQTELTVSQTSTTAEARDEAEQGTNMLLEGLTAFLASN